MIRAINLALGDRSGMLETLEKNVGAEAESTGGESREGGAEEADRGDAEVFA